MQITYFFNSKRWY